MRERGLAVGLGSDGAASNNTLDMWEQMRLAAMLQKHERADARVLTIPEAISMATCEGARVIGQADNLGRLAPSYFADLILVRLDGRMSSQCIASARRWSMPCGRAMWTARLWMVGCSCAIASC
jgi:cytosine/adenosine deaminase-related metal-dependent hydrolase